MNLTTLFTVGMVSSILICFGHSATVSFTITLHSEVSTTGGLSPGQIFNGSVTYNNNFVPTTGTATLTRDLDSTLTLDLAFAGDFYTSADDFDYPLFPEFYFIDGEIHGITYLAANKNPLSDQDGFIQIEGSNQIFTYSFDGNKEYTGTVSWPVDTIPEPSAFLLGATGILLFLRKRTIR